MAYITGAENYVINNATAITMQIPASTQTDDVVLMVIAGYRTTPITSVVGNNGGTWSLAIDASGGNDDSFVYTCAQAATKDTTVTMTFTAADYACITLVNVRGADTTTPIQAGYSSTSTLVQRTMSIPSITTTSANSLVFRLGGARSYPVYPQEGSTVISTDETASSFYLATLTYSNKITAGVVPAETWNHATNFGAGNYSATRITFAVTDNGNGHIMPALDYTIAPYKYLSTMSRYDGFLASASWYNPLSVSYEGLSSLSNDSYTNSNLIDREFSIVTDAMKSGWRSIATATTSNTYSDYVILGGYPITETYGTVDNYDLSGKLLCVSNKSSDPRVHPDSDIGCVIGISDQTNARFWQLGTTNSVPSLNDGTFPTIIDVDDSSFVMDEIGTPNTTSIGAVIVGSEPTTSYINVFFSPIFFLGTLKCHGGSSVVPASFNTFYENVSANLLNTVLAQGGIASGQFIVCQDTQCGGSEVVFWDSRNQSVEWPSIYNSPAKKRNFKISDGRLTHTIAGIVGSTQIYSATTLNFGNYHNLVVNTPATITAIGLVVLNANVTLVNHASDVSPLTGATFSGCKEIINSIDLSGGNTISSCVDAQAITVTSEAEFAKLYNCTFKDNTTAIKITGNQTGSWSDPNLTVSGNTYDIEYTGTTDFSISSNNTLTHNDTGGGILTIISGGSSVTFTGIPSGAEYRLYEDDAATDVIGSVELQGVESHTGGSVVYSFTSGAGDPVVLQVIADGYTERLLRFDLPATPQTLSVDLVAETNL